jgi:hypothetical protein
MSDLKRDVNDRMARVHVSMYGYLPDIIDALVQAVVQNPGCVGVWDAERLERAAEMIREANKN